ncbi:MAG: histidine phosphatase family protein [Clostridia bacterium]|nr:histidine phosphatase family protein [Clostridia bacterium]
MKLYIVRHGNTPSQPALAELHDPPLSELGHKQAQALAQRLKDVCFDRIYTSPLQRCVATAGYVNAIQGTQAQIVNAMLEKGTKANDCGLPFSCLLHLCGFLCENRLTEYACGLPDTETDEQALARAKSVIRYVRHEHTDESAVLLVAHGTFNNFLIHAALDFPLREHFNFSQDNTGLTLVEYLEDHGQAHTKLRFMNDTAHLKDL